MKNNNQEFSRRFSKCYILHRFAVVLILLLGIIGVGLIILEIFDIVSAMWLFVYFGIMLTLLYLLSYIVYKAPLIFKVKCPSCNQQLDALKFKLENGKKKMYCFCSECNKELTAGV